MSGGRGAFSFGKSRAKLFISNLPKVTFKNEALNADLHENLFEKP